MWLAPLPGGSSGFCSSLFFKAAFAPAAMSCSVISLFLENLYIINLQPLEVGTAKSRLYQPVGIPIILFFVRIDQLTISITIDFSILQIPFEPHFFRFITFFPESYLIIIMYHYPGIIATAGPQLVSNPYLYPAVK
jgi:hypothetical protein